MIPFGRATLRVDISRATTHSDRRSIISAAVADAEPGTAFRLYVGRQLPPPHGWLDSLMPRRFQWELDAANARVRNAWLQEVNGAA